MMLQENFPYGMVSRNQQHNQISVQLLYAAYKANDTTLINKISSAVRKDAEQQRTYYQLLSDVRRDRLSHEEERNEMLLGALNQLDQQFKAMRQQIEAGAQIRTETIPQAADSR